MHSRISPASTAIAVPVEVRPEADGVLAIAPIATEALRRIADLYAVEKRIRDQPAEARQRARTEASQPLVEAIKFRLEAKLCRAPSRGEEMWSDV